jgi:Transposase domain (DUF772).
MASASRIMCRRITCFGRSNGSLIGPVYASIFAPFIARRGGHRLIRMLMIRMLIVGYCMGIRSERRLCGEVHLNLAYRWSTDPCLAAIFFCQIVIGEAGTAPMTKKCSGEWLHRASLGRPRLIQIIGYPQWGF